MLCRPTLIVWDYRNQTPFGTPTLLPKREETLPCQEVNLWCLHLPTTFIFRNKVRVHRCRDNADNPLFPWRLSLIGVRATTAGLPTVLGGTNLCSLSHLQARVSTLVRRILVYGFFYVLRPLHPAEGKRVLRAEARSYDLYYSAIFLWSNSFLVPH